MLMQNCPVEHIANFELLLQYYQVSELAKSFLWEPFFPVNMDDTVLHALLLLSKHRVHVLPVIQEPQAGLIGYVTQVSAELSTGFE